MIIFNNNIWINSLPGLFIVLTCTLISGINIRRQTYMFILVTHLLFSSIAILLFGNIVILYSVLFIILLSYRKYQYKYILPDTPEYDFTDRIYSISMISNTILKKAIDSTSITIGRVLPNNKFEIKYNNTPIKMQNTHLSGVTLITGSTGSGKALHKDTLIPIQDGSTKSIGNINIGDIILDDSGNSSTVIEKHHPYDDTFYEIEFDNGTILKTSGNHLWKLYDNNNIVDSNFLYNTYNTVKLPLTAPIYYKSNQTQFYAYMFGTTICSNKYEELFNYDNSMSCVNSSIFKWLDQYVYNSISTRIQFLCGCLDEVNCIDIINGINNEVIITLKHNNFNIISKIRQLIVSLGQWCSVVNVTATLNDNKQYDITKTYYIKFSLNTHVLYHKSFNIRHNMMLLNVLNNTSYYKDYICIKNMSKLEHQKSSDYYCIAVSSGSHMFLCTDSYIPTHNTTTLLSIVKQQIAANKPVVLFDYKGEDSILEELEYYSNTKSVPYYEFSNRKCNFIYDPLINLNATGRVEALMNTRRWDASGADEHYRSSTKLLIQNVIYAYDSYRQQHNDTSNYLLGLRTFLNTYKPDKSEYSGFETLLKQLDIILTSSFKHMLSDNNMPEFTFKDNDGPYVVCFSFISANKELANSISSFVFQDILDRGTKKRYSPELMLSIDEFGTLESSTLIKDIIEKGRSGGCQTLFSILDINQIAMTSGEHFVHAILGTINSFIIHAGATQTTADLLAGVQKYSNKGYSVMDLRKPYNGKPPTALFISKYPVLSKKGTQEMYRIVPYIFKDKNDSSTKVHSSNTIANLDVYHYNENETYEFNETTYEEAPLYEEEVVEEFYNTNDIDKFLE